MRLKESIYIWSHLPHERVYENKDPILFQRTLNDVQSRRDHYNAWWDIQFDVMFCFGEKWLRQIYKSIKTFKKEKQHILADTSLPLKVREEVAEWVQA